MRANRNTARYFGKHYGVDLPIQQINQIGEYDCNYACAESIDNYYGNGRNQNYFQRLEPGKTGKGLTDVEIGRMYGKSGYVPKEIPIKNRKTIEIINDISDVMSTNKAVILNYKTGVSDVINSTGQKIMFGHATVINRLRIFDNGRFIINVMNPGGSSTRFTSIKQIHKIIGINKR